MELSIFILFFVTTFVVVFTPGAAAIAIASQAAANGGKAALSGVLGVGSANVIYFVLSATGVASLIIASHMLFAAIKWVGVGYLVYLGLQAIFSKAGAIRVDKTAPLAKKSKLFMAGFIIEIANPKALLYFAAILPQFLDLSKPLVSQFLIMGFVTFFLDFVSYSSYAFLGDMLAKGAFKTWMVNVLNKVAGVALLFAAFKMAGVEADR